MAGSNGSSLSPSMLEQLNPASFSADRAACWINRLWIISLTISLLVFLFAILTKQWLGEYSSKMRSHVGSHRLWAHRHITFSNGLDKWQVDAFIATLPLMLHASLALFLSGLIVWLFHINSDISIATLILYAASATFYLACTVTPLFYGNCPTATPFLRLSYKIWNTMLNSTTRIARGAEDLGRQIFQLPDKNARQTHYFSTPHAAESDEETLMKGRTHLLDEEALKWIVTSLPAAEEVIVGLDAIGALKDVHRFTTVLDHLEFHGQSSDTSHPLDDPRLLAVATRRFERLTTELAHTASDLTVARFIHTALALSSTARHSHFIAQTCGRRAIVTIFRSYSSHARSLMGHATCGKL